MIGEFFSELDRSVDWKGVCESAYREKYGESVKVDAVREVATPLYAKSVEQWCVRVSYKLRDCEKLGHLKALVSDTPYVQSEDLLPYCYRDALRMLAINVFGKSFVGSDGEMLLNFAAGGYL